MGACDSASSTQTFVSVLESRVQKSWQLPGQLLPGLLQGASTQQVVAGRQF